MKIEIDTENIPDYIDFQKVLSEYNLTQKECARILRNSERTVSRWFSGEVEIPYCSWRLLLYELGLIDSRKKIIKQTADSIKEIFDGFFEIKKEFQRIIENDPAANSQSFVIYDTEKNIYVYKVVFFQNSMRAMIRGVDAVIFERDIKTGIDFLKKMLKEQRVLSYLPDALLISSDGSAERMNRNY